MAEVTLSRTPGDRRLYAIEGIGTLRLEGFFARTATAEARGRSWRVARRGLLGRRFEATDAAGIVVGSFEPRTVRRGGALRWSGRELALRPASAWRERYALADGDDELAVLDGKGWGRRPVKVTLEPGSLDPGLVLFAAFVVRGLAEDASGAAAASSSAAVG